MTYRGMGAPVPTVQPIPDPWYQQKARQLQRVAAATAGLGQNGPTAEPPLPSAPKYGLMVGWGAVILLTAGIFFAATRGTGTKVRANRRRRRTRRGTRRRASKRRTSRRRRKSSLRRYKALSAASRRRMPPSSFALPGKRFPIAGPPGSSTGRNKWQAMQAIRYLNMGRVSTKQEYLAVRNAIIRRYGSAFWRSYDGPSWEKVQRAKRKRATTRRKRGRRVTRRVAANPKLVGNRPRRGTRRRSSAKSRVGYALATLRHAHASPKKAGLSARIARSLARSTAGLYRVGGGKVVKYRPSTSLQGAMTSTRIAASASRETHWLVKVYQSGTPKVVVVRKVDSKGRTTYRVEDSARRKRARRRRAA